MIHPVEQPLIYAQKARSKKIEIDPAAANANRRTVYSARSTDISAVPTSPHLRDDFRGSALWNQAFRTVGRMPTENDGTSSIHNHKENQAKPKILKKSDVLHFPAPVQTPSLDSPLELKTVDLNIVENTKSHMTDEFYATRRAKTPQLVLRRGASFDIHATFYRDFNLDVDVLKVIFEIGELPTVANATKVIVPVNEEKRSKENEWQAKISSVDGSRLSLRINVAANAVVGCWNMKIVSSLKHQPSAGFLDSVSLIHGVYILFNPWCPDDAVFLNDDGQRHEYVLNDSGKIWRGSHNSLRPTYWNFGQFEKGVLEAVIYVLERSRLPHPQRANPMQIARLIAQVVNSVDDNGILVGNWTNDFTGGTAPTEWTGSVQILTQYAESGQPVMYGQCWVFAGVATTILRALGIPSRVVTNYSSAHDSSTTVTIDLHINNNGKIDRSHTTDSIWAYHVWNECWLARPDLPNEYSGWQAIDATPQEKSDGLYRVGPTSVRAAREGKIGFANDTGYLFAEVNAEKCYWLLSDDGSERLIDVQPSEIGQVISTKKPGRKFAGMNNEDRIDLTDSYKVTDASERRKTLDILLPGHARLMQPTHVPQNDVVLKWNMNKPVNIGDDFEAVVLLTNRSNEERTVKFSMRIESMQYFGGELHKIRSETKSITLQPNSVQEAKMPVPLREYLSKAMPQYAFMLTALARVIQTGQIFLATDDFRVKMPNVKIKAADKLTVGRPGALILELINPLPVTLSRSKFIVDCPGVVSHEVIQCGDVPPRGSVTAECPVTPWRNGTDFVVVAHFSSDQLHDIDGAASVDVK